ncbi:MAG: GDSL-type esterase/lipase family protein [Phormidesmis sp.]
MKAKVPWIGAGVGLLVILLGGSIFLNVALWKRAKQYYIEANATRLDPLGLSAFESENLPEKSSTRKRVVMIGDSRVQAWPMPKLADYEFINRGIGSQTSIQVLERFEAHVAPLHPDVVLVQVGINDIKTIGLLPDQATEILNNARANITQLVDQATQTGATVALSSILPAGEITLARRPFWSNEIDTAVAEMNAYLKLLAEESEKDQVVWFDGYAAIADEQGQMKAAYRKDELHLNKYGYEALNQAFVARLHTIELD